MLPHCKFERKPVSIYFSELPLSLINLQRILHHSLIHFTAEEVPIINLKSHFGFEADIAVGGHNGTDTSSYASLQVSRFKSFPAVVLVLKMLLREHGLDKPFKGGMGSYSLYVLVAHHVGTRVDWSQSLCLWTERCSLIPFDCGGGTS
jgi:DNA polymerase sigma